MGKPDRTPRRREPANRSVDPAPDVLDPELVTVGVRVLDDAVERGRRIVAREVVGEVDPTVLVVAVTALERPVAVQVTDRAEARHGEDGEERLVPTAAAVAHA
jgi:hypothetical protein